VVGVDGSDEGGYDGYGVEAAGFGSSHLLFQQSKLWKGQHDLLHIWSDLFVMFTTNGRKALRFRRFKRCACWKNWNPSDEIKFIFAFFRDDMGPLRDLKKHQSIEQDL